MNAIGRGSDAPSFEVKEYAQYRDVVLKQGAGADVPPATRTGALLLKLTGQPGKYLAAHTTGSFATAEPSLGAGAISAEAKEFPR